MIGGPTTRLAGLLRRVRPSLVARRGAEGGACACQSAIGKRVRTTSIEPCRPFDRRSATSRPNVVAISAAEGNSGQPRVACDFGNGSFATGSSRQQVKPCARCPESGSFQSTAAPRGPRRPTEFRTLQISRSVRLVRNGAFAPRPLPRSLRRISEPSGVYRGRQADSKPQSPSAVSPG
jgi:hypothetical protein